MTSENFLRELKEGNQRFREGKMLHPRTDLEAGSPPLFLFAYLQATIGLASLSGSKRAVAASCAKTIAYRPQVEGGVFRSEAESSASSSSSKFHPSGESRQTKVLE